MTIKIAIIGSGPSAFYSAQSLLKSTEDCEIDIIEKLFSPYGLIRYGVAPDHQKTKNVIRVFERILNRDQVEFFGGVEIGKTISFEKLKQFYDAIIIATGMGIDRKLGIEGDNKLGCYGAAEFVGWYNGHPDYKNLITHLNGETAVIIGNGNVAIDCARVLAKTSLEMAFSDITEYSSTTIQNSNLKNIYIIGRRGPLDAKFTTVEIREMGELQDCNSILADGTLSQIPKNINLENIEKQYKILTSFPEKSSLPTSSAKNKNIEFKFFSKPIAILGEENIEAVRFEINSVDKNNNIIGTGETFEIKTNLLISAIGYFGEKIKGVPYDEKNGKIINVDNVIDKNLFAAGWIARGPSGVIGTNKHDGDKVAKQIIENINPSKKDGRDSLFKYLNNYKIRYINKLNWEKINAEELKRAQGDAARKKFTNFDAVYEFQNNII